MSTEGGHNHKKLMAEIIARSESQSWDEARLEWELEDIIRADRNEPRSCLCEHFPILELCIIRNKRNQNRAIVGNVCVKKFMGIDVGKVFQAISRIAADDARALNRDSIDFVYERNWISQNEHKFYCETWRKKYLSPKQRQWRIDINRRVLRRIATPPPVIESPAAKPINKPPLHPPHPPVMRKPPHPPPKLVMRKPPPHPPPMSKPPTSKLLGKRPLPPPPTYKPLRRIPPLPPPYNPKS